MTSTRTHDRGIAAAQPAWIAGGILLVASGIFAFVARPSGTPGYVVSITGVALFSAALLVFAFGARGSGSMAGGRVGTAALVVLAVWRLASAVFWGALAVESGSALIQAQGLLITLNYIDLLVQFAAALVVVIRIGRARVVPRPWNWAPAWALAVVVAEWVLGQALAAVEWVPFLNGLGIAVEVCVPVFLGVLAVVLATPGVRRARGGRAVPSRAGSGS